LGCDYGDGHANIDNNCNVKILMEKVMLQEFGVYEKFVN
jgi:hypothetical protein